MQLARPSFALDPRRFGRASLRVLQESPVSLEMNADLKLFAMTFLAGFLFVSVLIA
jgi:hypothetical protein